MTERSLQNDNKIKKTKKSGFFDMDDAVADGADAVSERTEKPAKSTDGSDASGKRFKVKVIVFVSALAVLLILAAVLSGMDFISDSSYNDDGVPKQDESPSIVFEIYDPDWETDIFTVPEYLELSPERIEYSDDGGLSYKKADREDLERVGGSKLVFLNSYFDAVKRGDHEAVNAMLTEAYIEENGEYEDFPMQKIFNIKITRKNYNDPAYDNAEYDDYYFVVSYNIYRNDGLFRADCDDQYYCRTLMRVLINSEGDGKIDLITDYYGE